MAVIEAKIVPFLWFDNRAEEAVEFYSGLFLILAYWRSPGMGTQDRGSGSVMTIEFELAGQRFIALNGGRISILPRQCHFP
jgi:predicted 3-demethylubiquinone-9 3-methyltransferase (glyoxalase superfamily)